jgi:hypothetical protein
MASSFSASLRVTVAGSFPNLGFPNDPYYGPYQGRIHLALKANFL